MMTQTSACNLPSAPHRRWTRAVANQVANSLNYRVVAGVNLPMLVRIYNYPELSLDDIVNSAVEAGRQGILPCTEPPLSQHETDKKKHA